MTRSLEIQGLSKLYRLGRAQHDQMLRERLVEMIKRPFGGMKEVESIWALRDISFDADEGEVIGIVGRNGAGKSTLLKILSRITYPTSGEVKVNGRVASLLEVGTGFHDELTGRENIYLNGSILGMRKREVEERFDAIVDFSGVEQFIDTPIKHYSSGMRLRLGFAVAAHLEPDVLIVDEVLAVGDAAFQKKCISAMQDLRGGGRTVLFVSHNMAAVENLCSRGLWIANGQLCLDGPTHEVIEAYMASFAASDSASNELTAVDGRRGSGEVRYTRIEFLSTDGDLQTVTRSGKSLVVRMHYRASQLIEHPSFGFRLYTDLGTLVTDTSTWLHGLVIPNLPAGDGYLDLEIDSLNLLPARYYLSLFIGSSVSQHVYEALENALHLDIEEAAIYGSSRRFSNKYGLVFFPQRWRLEGIRGASELDVKTAPAVNG